MDQDNPAPKPRRNWLVEVIRKSWVRDNPHYDKPQLLLACYENTEDTESPHVALLIIPKLERDKSGQVKLPIEGIKYHVKNKLLTSKGEVSQPWFFERVDFRNLDAEPGILVCVVIGKVLDLARAANVMAAVPVYQDHMYSFGSRVWAQQAIELLLAAGATTGVYGKTALGGVDSYLREKRGEGRWSGGRRAWPTSTVPILDMTTGVQERN